MNPASLLNQYFLFYWHRFNKFRNNVFYFLQFVDAFFRERWCVYMREREKESFLWLFLAYLYIVLSCLSRISKFEIIFFLFFIPSSVSICVGPLPHCLGVLQFCLTYGNSVMFMFHLMLFLKSMLVRKRNVWLY